MACIIKSPTENSKGVVVFTDLERDQIISKDKILCEKILSLKNNWLVGMHHNWTRFDSDCNHIFDFAMYLKDNYSGKLPLVPFAACNFAPKFFKSTTEEKFWDILYVARAVKFKNIPEFLQSIRKLYDLGRKYRVLFICPVPPYKWSDRKNILRNIRKIYDEMFNEEEKDFFTLLTTNFRNPFPFDLETLAHFYRVSRVFVHTSNKEKQGRAVGYAWACGMPVVGLECIGTPLPDKFKTKPYFYEAENYEDFPSLLEEAVETSRVEMSSASSWPEVMSLFSETKTKEDLIGELRKQFSREKLSYGHGNEFFHNLGLRIARHHNIMPITASSLEMSIHRFTDILENKIQIIQEMDSKIIDPENELVKMFPTNKRKPLFERAKIKKTLRKIRNDINIMKIWLKNKIKRLIGR